MEFIYGETPTYFVGRLDHFANVPVWYEEAEPEPDRRSMYEVAGLARELRTPSLKLYHALFNLYSSGWKDINFLFLVGHLACQPESEITIVDGYPDRVLQLWHKHFYDLVDDLQLEILHKGRVQIAPVFSFTGYQNIISAVEAEAKEEDYNFVDITHTNLNDLIPGMQAFNDALHNTQQSMWKAEQQSRGGMSVDPAELAHIQKLIKDDEGNGGSGINH